MAYKKSNTVAIATRRGGRGRFLGREKGRNHCRGTFPALVGPPFQVRYEVRVTLRVHRGEGLLVMQGGGPGVTLLPM